jgi:hypothetical protein
MESWIVYLIIVGVILAMFIVICIIDALVETCCCFNIIKALYDDCDICYCRNKITDIEIGRR